MDKAHILIVDDDTALLEALPQALYLRLDGVKVDTCDSAQAAIEQIGEYEYAAIVSDIKMPGMDGLALLAKIQELQPDTPTLLITGHGEHDLAVQALRGGAYDFIQKPIDREYFLAALRRAIGSRLLSRQVQEQRVALESHTAELERVVEERTRQLVEANERLRNSITETHHRVKNNLQLMTALLEIEAKKGKVPGEASKRLASYMATLAAVHELLTVESVEDSE